MWYKSFMPDSITCPKCGTQIEVTEVLSSQLREQIRSEFAADARQKEQDFATREKALREEQAEIEASRKSLDAEIEARVAKERETLSRQAAEKAKEAVALELKDKESELTEAKTKLQQAQQAELDLRKKARELEEQKREFDITLQRTLDQERDKIRETAKKEAADDRALKDAEKDKLINDLKKQIDDLKRKSEQGSQQAQGEVMELQLESLLSSNFPHDSIVPVPKGVHGGDVFQHVHDHNGRHCGTILWESKRTKNWTDTWLPKLRDDQRAGKAQLAVLVSIELPSDINTFACRDGVWVTNWPCAIGLTHALRTGLIEAANAKAAAEGQQGKMEVLYNYLSGSEFRHRVEGIVEAFMTLRNDLEAEKRAMQRAWAKREKQLERAVAHTAGLYGDLSGIFVGTLPKIEHLELPAIGISEDNADSQAQPPTENER